VQETCFKLAEICIKLFCASNFQKFESNSEANPNIQPNAPTPIQTPQHPSKHPSQRPNIQPNALTSIPTPQHPTQRPNIHPNIHPNAQHPSKVGSGKSKKSGSGFGIDKMVGRDIPENPG
jgi:hypothetical protein